MCGIAGVLSFGQRAADAAQIRRMTDALAHRGPDGEGIWIQGPVGLGHRRLAIIDLSDRAAQPMATEDESLVVVFNGEIYNYAELAAELKAKGHRFRTSSDTEVLLHLYREYGIDCLQHLRGMFAFALWDEPARSLFVARDRIGIKPLYYLASHSDFAFSSELKGIAASGLSRRRIDRQALAHYFRFLSVPQPWTIYEDVRKLEPGHYLRIDADGTIEENCYWRIEDHIGSIGGGESSLVDRLDSHLQESIAYHLVADVPVGAFLSGGLDSSGVVALMRAVAPRQAIDTFSTVFPGLREYDEGFYARRVSVEKETVHHESTLSESFLDDYPSIAWYLDEPFAIGSAHALYYLSAAAAHNTKVVLSGDGGDELFGGYRGYTNDAYRRHHRWQTAAIGQAYGALRQIDRTLRPRSRTFLRTLTKLRELGGSEGLRYSEQVAQNSLHAMSTVLERGLLRDCLGHWQHNVLGRHYDALATPDLLLKKLYAEYKSRLVDEMLTKVDRMTMAHSLEARVPLLDHKLVEFAFACPSRAKIGNTDGQPVGKYLLKKVLERHLPHDIVYRRKHGYNVPLATWLGGKSSATVTEVLLGGYLARNGLITETGVRELFARQNDPRHNYRNMLFALTAFEYWHRAYDQNLPNHPT